MGIVEGVPRAIRQCIDEGIVLGGIYALMIGQSMTPWFPGAHEVGGTTSNCSRHLSAYANYMLFKSLIKNRVYIMGINNYTLMVKYLFNALIHW